MGYITSYSLEVEGDNSFYIISDLRKLNEAANFAIDEDGYSEEPVKWYEAKEDIINFSKKYPDNLFILSGEGEDRWDIWKLYAKNGKSTLIQATITWKPFDDSMLT